MYIIKNIVEDKIIGEYKTDAEFVYFMNVIAVENEDNVTITTSGEAKDYLNNYCGNLALTNL